MPVDDIKENLDKTGLGLGDFLRGTAESSPAKEEVQAEVKTDAAPTPKTDDKASVVAAKDEKVAKPDDKVPVADKKVAAKAPTDKPAEVISPDAKANWDDENNPWKKKASEFDQRYRDTHRNWNQLNQQNQELQRNLNILQKKFDGTYDPRVDEPPPPDPQAIRQWGAIEGKAQASLAAANRVHGEEKVMQTLEKYAQVFGNDRGVQERILMSNDPVQGAMDAVAGFEFFSENGPDPKTILENIRKKVTDELTPQIREAESKRIMGELASKRGEPKGIGHVLGSSGATDKQVGKDNTGRAKPLEAIFGR